MSATGNNNWFQSLATRQPQAPVATAPVAAAPSLEQQTTDQLGQQNNLAAMNQSAINAFYQDPARQQEIGRTVNAGLGQAMSGLELQIRDSSRQQAFERARTGNMMGSHQAGQQAGLMAAQQAGTMQNVQSAEAQRDAMNQQMQQQYQQEMLGTFGMDPFIEQMINERLQGLGVESAGNAAMFGLDQQRQQQNEFASDELSRSFGNIVNQAGQYYTIDQRAQMLGRQGLWG